MKQSAPPTATVPDVSASFKVGQIVDLNKGEVLHFEQFINEIASKKIIFVGEVHDNPEHHLIQTQIIQALIDIHGPVTVAMEIFQKPQQPILDQYLRGDLTEGDFLRKVNWRNEWGVDYHFYRPILLTAKQNKSNVLAINAPRDIVKKVARHGVKSLDATERQKLAKEIDLSNKAHRDYVQRIYTHHAHKDLKRFDYFYEAQCVWEDSMAQNLAEYLKRNGGKIIVIIGNGHIVNRFGVPERTIWRLPVSMATVMPYAMNEDEGFTKEIADYVWVTPRYPRRSPHAPRTEQGPHRGDSSDGT
jgi:uncharacterized iron-regulated protein